MTTLTFEIPDDAPILQWRNGNWGHQYHRNFFKNMLAIHIKSINGYRNKNVAHLTLLKELGDGKVVTVNKVQFRFMYMKPEKTE